MTILAQQKGNSFVPYILGSREIYKLYLFEINSIQDLKAQLHKTLLREYHPLRDIGIILFWTLMCVLSFIRASKAKTSPDSKTKAS